MKILEPTIQGRYRAGVASVEAWCDTEKGLITATFSDHQAANQWMQNMSSGSSGCGIYGSSTIYPPRSAIKLQHATRRLFN